MMTYPLFEKRLDNGLRVIVNPDHNVPVVAVNLWYDVGSADEAPDKTGLAHLFEHLMFQGSAHVKSGDHIGLAQAAGGSVNGTTSYDRTNYFEAVPTSALRMMLWMEADRLGTLLETVDQASLDNQREVVKEEKRQRYDNVPYGDAWHRILALLFPEGHPYAHPTIGSMKHLEEATLADMQAFFRANYRASRLILTLAGDVKPDHGFRLAEQYFGDLPSLPGRRRPYLAALPPHEGVPRSEITSAVPRDAVYAAWRLPKAGDPDLEALGLATSVLGDGITSRLHQALVRTELAEGAGAFTMSLARGNSVGVASARCWDGVEPAALEAAMLEAWQQFVDEGPSTEEHERAQAQFAREWLTELSALDQRADRFGQAATLHGSPDWVNQRLRTVLAVTKDDVVRATRQWLAPDNRAVLTYRSQQA
jgi:predicted Zn-dependent peptidase